MTDIVSRETRSRMMAAIGPTNTRPELRVRSYLHRAGLRFRLHVKALPGTPDLVFPKHKAVVFVHGCFWHRHGGCRFAATPATRPEFWAAKFASNVARDRRQAELLRAMGWRVLTVFECETYDLHALESLSHAIVAAPA
jgi:DNA mismatch endonuclease (patch repair protein)